MLGSVTVLLGPEEGLKNELIEKEAKEIKKAFPYLDEKNVYAFEFSDQDFFNAMMTPSLFSSNTLLVIREFVKPKQALVNAILEYIKQPTEGNFLILVSPETAYSFPSTILNKVPKANQKVFYELTQQKKFQYVKDYFFNEGFNITGDAVTLLLSLVDNNTGEIRAYASQLANYFHMIEGKKVIDVSDISTYLAHTKREDGFSLFSYIANGQTEKAIASIKNILLYDPRGIIGIISILQRQFRLLSSFLAELKHSSIEEAVKNAKAISTAALSKTAAQSKVFTEQNVLKEASKHYREEDALRILTLLDEADLTTRELNGEMLTFYLELLVISIIENKGKKSNLTLQNELMENSLN